MGAYYNVIKRRNKGCSMIWVCLLVYISTSATTAYTVIGCMDCGTNDNKTVDYYDDPCSRDILRTILHGAVSVFESCDTSAVITDQLTNEIIKFVPELNSQNYLVIICPATATSNTLECSYSIYITEIMNNVIMTNNRLTRVSVAALQSTFTTITMFEPEGKNEGSRDPRAASESGSGSGDMGSGTGSASPPVDVDQPDNFGDLEIWHIGLISFGALSLLFCFIFTLMILYFMRKRRSRPHSSHSTFPITFDDGDLELHPITPQMPKKISRISLKHFTSPVLTNLLDMNSLKQMLDNYRRIEEEYSKLPRDMVTVEHIPAGTACKNRYIDILPNPRTRVALYLQNGVSNSDYINANFIRGYKTSNKRYIATQGPLTNTLEDFWRMIWEQRCSAIVMLTNLVEGGREKCYQYWPDEHANRILVCGDLIITLSGMQSKNNYLMTTLQVQHKDKAVSREINHFWFTAWPDHGVPDNTIPVIAFIREVRNHQKEIPGPILVHCSAGIGRTGVFISSDIGMRHLEENNEVDILKIVSTLRQDRGGMVQTVIQYHFVYKLLYDYGCYLQRMSSSQLVQLQGQQRHTVSEGSLNDTSDATDHDGHDSQASLII